jgi:hypothetical protein
MLEELLPLCQAQLGMTNLESLAVLNSLGRTYHVVGRLTNALPLLEQCLTWRRHALRPDSPGRSHLREQSGHCLA